jgi:hypothetical protein
VNTQLRRPQDTIKHLHDDVSEDRCGIPEEQDEVLMVPEANAIIHPRAMVIHPENTSVADTTMMASVWLVLQAPLTMAPFPRMLLFSNTHLRP